MANKNKKAASAAQEAAKVAAAPKPEEKAPEVTQEEAQILKMGNILKNSSRMSADSKAIVANLLQKRVIENPNAPEQVVDGASVVIDAMLADVIVTGVAMGEDVFAMIIRKDENKYLALQSMLNAQGITIPAFKTLPAPTAEQLQKAGVNLLPAESVVVAVDKKDVDKKVVEKKKKELKAEASKPSLDPTKIKDEKDLKNNLTYIFVDSNSTPTERILKAINFYSAYLNVQAKGDKKEEEKVAALSKEEILQKITDIIGPATFVVNGMMYQPCRATNETGVPVSAFCIVKRMFETSKVFNDKMDDEFIAAVTKVLVTWSCKTHINEYETMIARNKANLKKFEADKTKNAAAIKIENAAMKANESEILGYKSIIDSLTNVNFNAITTLSEDYKNSDKNTLKFKNARRIVANIITAFYPDTNVSDYEEDDALNAAKILAGKVMNLFANPAERNVNYIDAVVPVLEKKQPKEEKKDGEESKN